MERIAGGRVVNFASILEEKTRAQACTASTMPFIYPHLALMPDAHLGKGATVGSVLPTLGAIMPAAVGVDIGCGMMAVRTQWRRRDVDQRAAHVLHGLRVLHAAISKAVPLSAGGANPKVGPTARSRVDQLETMAGVEQAEKALPRWRLQLGSLGSGNHFIEISEDESHAVWLFLHSGSRGVGNRLAGTHIAIAQQLCHGGGIDLPDRDLAYLTEGTAEFDAYIEALNWAQHYALLNRQEMMDRVAGCIGDFMGEPVQRLQEVNCHHNYTVRETHAGREVWLSRKGAIDAHSGVYGLIPGSMGDLSYVVVGRGNPEALNSAPHGAGRNYSRTAARKQFSRQDLNSRMDGIVWGESDAFLDEHPEAYKPIDQVMKDAADLVDVVHELRQFVNVKGN